MNGTWEIAWRACLVSLDSSRTRSPGLVVRQGLGALSLMKGKGGTP